MIRRLMIDIMSDTYIYSEACIYYTINTIDILSLSSYEINILICSPISVGELSEQDGLCNYQKLVRCLILYI